ncbi:hypothetical protein BHM03_00044349 [Ensete ventricosum]|nr:hypothetical protein BHM03_00044349 [Ensete ventricosum]
MPVGGASVGVAPLRAGRGRALPLRPPLLVALVACGCPCKGPGHSRPPLQRVWSWPAALAKGLAMTGRPLSSLPSLRKHSKKA